MAAIQSNGTGGGNWNAGSSWNGGTSPGVGDTVTILAGDTITATASQAFGTSPAAGNTVLVINGTLNVTGGIFEPRGDVDQDNDAVVTFSAGTGINFNAANATDPTNQNYQWFIGRDSGSQANPLTMNGTSGNKCTVTSEAGGGNGNFAPGFTGASNGVLNGSWIDFTDIGTATKEAIYAWAGSNGALDLQNCIFDSCGQVRSAGASNQSETWKNISFRNSLNATCFRVASGSGTGTRLLSRIFFDRQVDLFSGEGWTMEDLIFWGGMSSTNSAWVSMDRIILRRTAQSSTTFQHDASDVYFWADHAIANPHFVIPTGSRDVTLTRFILEYAGTDANGDGFLCPSSPSAERTYTLRQWIIARSDDGGNGHSCTLASSLGNAFVNVDAKNCTVIVFGDTGGFIVGETFNSDAGLVDQLIDSIFYRPSGTGGKKIRNINGAPNTDVVLAADADYNCGFGLDAGSEGKGYDTPMTGTPGANDVDEDPDMVDDARNILAWHMARGGSARTSADLESELEKIGQTSFDEDRLPQNLVDYVRGGYEPQNLNLQGVASDSGDIGAVSITGGPPGFSTLELVTS